MAESQAIRRTVSAGMVSPSALLRLVSCSVTVFSMDTWLRMERTACSTGRN